LSEANHGQKCKTLSEKITKGKKKGAGGMTQVVECLPSKFEVTAKKPKTKNKNIKNQ
jgi:hypothetical protein